MPKFSGINRPYNADPIEKTPAEKQRELDARMKEFLEKGGKVEKVKPRITKDMLEKWRF
jgi:hypothetical protein|tara:strand:+ start:591 stop:767 length:177 start_codon:yes stop_codon:yes gene_type:complete